MWIYTPISSDLARDLILSENTSNLRSFSSEGDRKLKCTFSVWEWSLIVIKFDKDSSATYMVSESWQPKA